MRRVLSFFYTSLIFLALLILYKEGANSTLSADYPQGSFLQPKLQPGESQIVRLQIVINDPPGNSGKYIEKAYFNDYEIPLTPPNPTNLRGKMNTQVNPGVYKVRWIINNDNFAWPRDTEYTKEITITDRDTWINIVIEGENLYVE